MRMIARRLKEATIKKQTPEMVFVFVLLALNDRMMGGQPFQLGLGE